MRVLGPVGEKILVIEYRPFQNTDPPRLVALWHECQLGHGAAGGFSFDAFETINFSQSYFDSEGLIVACDGSRVVGYAHAGFGSNDDGSGLSHDDGVICAVMVHPDSRRRGIGRELVSRAESYLRSFGAESIFAGPGDRRDPFYVGLYGGSQPCGFLESDVSAAPFFAALSYEPVESYNVYARDITEASDPVNFRWMTIRRKMKLQIAVEQETPTWWWLTRFGRLDTVQFMLVGDEQSPPVATATVVGLDFYIPKWNQRAVGIIDLSVPEDKRRQGYGQALILEICRSLRQELVTSVHARVAGNDEATIKLVETTGLEQVDRGIVYRRTEA